MKVKLKVCGMKLPSNVKEVAELGPDYMGFIFYAGSKRYPGRLAAEVIRELPESIKKTGVFVNETVEEIAVKIVKYRLDAVQLHGNETPEMVKLLKMILPEEVQLIKAFGIDVSFDFSQLDAYASNVDFFLFDTKTPDHGGSGRRFEWELLQGYHLDKPYFLSGGVGLENVDDVLRITDQRLYAVDVNSRFELEPGLKDITKLKDFKTRLSL
ncbi:phosphoribosylanthranilate isomerase [Pedobacter sp. JY14-1]|uniref:phosphoribosylanthranilate isomerase n=1 Tax=Pedobacter sp. JY14-1 TaxID=3034151 RepID=UPI0023E1E2D8|nr:phosphoribosylanthranilate isomerase [Pedobacter sp. JY14-1]